MTLDLFGAVPPFVHGLLWKLVKKLWILLQRKALACPWPALLCNQGRQQGWVWFSGSKKGTVPAVEGQTLLKVSDDAWGGILSSKRVGNVYFPQCVQSVVMLPPTPVVPALYHVDSDVQCGPFLRCEKILPPPPYSHPQKTCACPALCGEFGESSADRESACNAGNPSSIPGSERSPGEGISHPLQYSWASLVAQMVKNPPAMKETWVRPLDWEDPLEEGMATHSSTVAWRISMDGGAWQATVHGVARSRTRLSDWA